MVVNIEKSIPNRFENFLFDWDYKTYFTIGGYGSGKSYQIATKIIIKALEEKRKILVVRNTLESIKESCYDLFAEILDDMNLMATGTFNTQYTKKRKLKVVQRKSPMEYRFPNGSRIIFMGMDNPQKVKSINNVSIVWLEECSEIKYDAYKELLGRLRTPNVSLHFFLSCNPVGKENWVYKHFFVNEDDNGDELVILNDEELYKRKTIIRNGVYYHHSTCDDNPFLPKEYINTLDDIRTYDTQLLRTARFGRFGPSGVRVLPQFQVARSSKAFKEAVQSIPLTHHFFGMDFGFEESYNAVISMAVDHRRKILYIYDEIYQNHVTDDVFAQSLKMQRLKQKQEQWSDKYMYHNPIVADNEDPKAIAYYSKSGFSIRKCMNKFAGSRLSNTRKIKRFKRIICSPKCKNTIRELKDLTYAKKSNGDTIYDQFNIDPHTFSAIWYGLDTYDVADIKEIKTNSYAG